MSRDRQTAEGMSFAANAHLREGDSARRRLLVVAESENRRQALLADPGLVVSATPREEFSDQEVQDLKRSVLLARRLSSVEAGGREPISRRLSGWAVALSVCLLFLLPSSLRQTPELEPTIPGPVSLLSSARMTHSSVEALDLPGARVYELADEDFSLVLVVDESFEL